MADKQMLTTLRQLRSRIRDVKRLMEIVQLLSKEDVPEWTVDEEENVQYLLKCVQQQIEFESRAEEYNESK